MARIVHKSAVEYPQKKGTAKRTAKGYKPPPESVPFSERRSVSMGWFT
jgi:hypothetical protein